MVIHRPNSAFIVPAHLELSLGSFVSCPGERSLSTSAPPSAFLGATQFFKGWGPFGRKPPEPHYIAGYYWKSLGLFASCPGRGGLIPSTTLCVSFWAWDQHASFNILIFMMLLLSVAALLYSEKVVSPFGWPIFFYPRYMWHRVG